MTDVYVVRQSLLGDTEKAMKTLHNYHQVWRQFGFTPEFYNIVNSNAHHMREAYPLRPGRGLQVHVCIWIIQFTFTCVRVCVYV